MRLAGCARCSAAAAARPTSWSPSTGRPGDRRRRVLLDARSVRLGQDDRAADDRRLRAARPPGRWSSAAGTSPGSPPFDRDVNTVFQDYALFPHLSVLRERRVRAEGQGRGRGRAAGAGRARPWTPSGWRASATAGPAQLSGGQRQRVALARALVNRPQVLLLDEPLGALDLKLREQMQVELKAIQREVGITFVFVTHDQEEALTMSDRVAVFNQGRIEQVGTAGGGLRAPGHRVRRRLRRHVEPARRGRARSCSARTATFTVRPEKIRLVDARTRRRRRARSSADGRGRRGRLRGRGHPAPSSTSTPAPELVVLEQNRRDLAPSDARPRAGQPGQLSGIASTTSRLRRRGRRDHDHDDAEAGS